MPCTHARGSGGAHNLEQRAVQQAGTHLSNLTQAIAAHATASRGDRADIERLSSCREHHEGQVLGQQLVQSGRLHIAAED
jgi:hypothetical protein